MLALHFRPCLSFPFSNHIPVKVKPSLLSPFLLSFPLSTTPRRAMSEPPQPPPPSNALDFLMSRARAAAKKNPPPSSSSPNKRKSPLPAPAPVQNPKTLQTPETVETLQQPNKPLETAQKEPPQEPLNKIRNVSKEIIAKLKERVPQLKKKPPEFDPSLVACWEKGKPVPFLFLALAFDMIAEESGRIVITDIVCNLMRTVIHVTPEDLVPVVYLSANRIAPAHEGLELGIGDASIIKALAEACGATESQIKNQYKVIDLFLHFSHNVC